MFLFFNNIYLLKGVEIDITEGRIEPFPIAISKFNYVNKNEKSYSLKIVDIMSNNLKNTGLFKLAVK